MVEEGKEKLRVLEELQMAAERLFIKVRKIVDELELRPVMKGTVCVCVW